VDEEDFATGERTRLEDDAEGGGVRFERALSLPLGNRGIGGRSEIFFFPFDFLSMTISNFEAGRSLTGSREREN
jgi:hypothetical protein